MAKLVLVDSLKGNSDALIVRRPGKPDEILVRGGRLTPEIVYRSVRQLKLLRAVQGETASVAGLYRVELRPGGRDPDEALKRTEAGRRLVDQEMYFARLLAGNLPGSQSRHSSADIGEGPAVDIWIKRVVVRP